MELISAGDNAPQEVNVLIEIEQGSYPAKYEFDKTIGMMVLDRFIHTDMRYPCNYGFIPGTLSGDGDPLDVLVYSKYPIAQKALVTSRPIGMLITHDEKGEDQKIIAVPSSKIDPYATDITEYHHLPDIFIKQVQFFFERYKDLEKNKWVKVEKWKGAAEAMHCVEQSINNFHISQE